MTGGERLDSVFGLLPGEGPVPILPIKEQISPTEPVDFYWENSDGTTTFIGTGPRPKEQDGTDR